MSSVAEFVDDQLALGVADLALQDEGKMKMKDVVEGEKGCVVSAIHHGVCAICLEGIGLEETALVKGCEHAYCVMCILRWASYKDRPKCPQCNLSFESLHVHRALDGSIYDYMFEESVCLLLRAAWFKPLAVVGRDDSLDDLADVYQHIFEEEQLEDDDDDLEDVYFGNSSGIRIGNRRWGDNGYVRTGRREARPVQRPNFQDTSGAGSSCEPKKEGGKELMGRRAKRAMKREAAEKADATKRHQHLVRMGRK